MSNIQKNIKDLIYFYIKENYKKYLQDNSLTIIPNDKIRPVIDSLYTDKKEHLKEFIKSSLKLLMKDEYPGDQTITNLTLNIFSDDELCKNRLLLEIKVYQESLNTQQINYSTVG
tara:strand:+ start:164 stop:508 length:345 start_codon:yes stop_codon:yes gene_type:complete